jgi:phosphate transport system substrate-binding protein
VRVRLLTTALLLAAVPALAAGCGRDDSSGSSDTGAPAATGGSQPTVSGSVQIDGSSTVAPFATYAAEQFQGQNPDVQVTVGTAGTGGGFERFCAGETDISDASRPIEPDEETICKDAGIDFTEFLVANDGITVVVPAENDWVDCLTVEQLKKMWEPGSKVDSWKDVDPSFPDEKLSLFGPGTDSGTFDFFTDVINGEEGASRTDYSPSENDNVIVQGVQGEKGALGYFGYSYYDENQDTLKAVQVDGGDGCVAPSPDTVRSGDYTPLSRPLFMYGKTEALGRPEVEAFMTYVVDNAPAVADGSRLIGLTSEQQSEAKSELAAATGQ